MNIRYIDILMVQLHKVLKNSYKYKNRQKSNLSKDGYIYDDELSNHNQQVYYNPNDKKLLYSITGTHNLQDIGNDIYLAFGKIKDTNRYKEADDILKKSKEKYKPDDTVITGHSLGGGIAGYIAKNNDKVYTLNKASTLFQRIKPNETAYRTSGDVVSLLSSNHKNINTLNNNNILTAHDVDNIKSNPIFL